MQTKKYQSLQLIPKHQRKSPIYRQPTRWELDEAQKGRTVFVTDNGERLSYVPKGYSVVDGSDRQTTTTKDGSDQYKGKVLPELVVTTPQLTREDREKLHLAKQNIQNQGEITPLTNDEAEERMGFSANLGDALGVTNARHDANRSLAARMADQMLWNLDSRNPRSNETYGAITAPMISFGGAPTTTTFQGLTTLGLSTLGGGAFNQLWRIIPGTEGKTWSQWLGDKVPLATSGTGELLNPGYLAGGLAQTQRARNALYSNIMPAGYGNVPSSVSNMKRFGRAIVDFVNPKWKFNPEEIPQWYKELSSLNTMFGDLPMSAVTEFRDQAWRTGLRIPLRKNQIPIYRVNEETIPSQSASTFGKPEHTVSYDLNNVNKIRRQFGVGDVDQPAKRFISKGINDQVTGNGGFVGYKTNSDGSSTMIDRWDLHPFSDERSPSKLLSKIIPNFEVLETFGGHPFTVKQNFVRIPIGRKVYKTTHGDIDLGPIYKTTSTTPTTGYVTSKTNSVSYLDPLIRSMSGIIGAKSVLE